MDNIICVTGPTASGKTKIAVELAKKYNGEVLSCDSMQVYRHMVIGTAAPTSCEMDGVPHHMVGVIDPTVKFSVSEYMAKADPILQDILARGKTAIIAGGTGLYLDSLISGRTFSPHPNTGRREQLERMADTQGMEHLHQYLESFDPDSAHRLHLSDRNRIIRAAEVFLETGITITEHNRRTQLVPPKYTPVWLGLSFTNRQDLYDRINLRVEHMIAAGLLDEIQSLLARGLDPSTTALQAIGYKEPLMAMNGQCTMDEALACMKQESRRYGKRQLTWFRKNPNIHWVLQEKEPNFPAIFSACTAHIASFDNELW